MALRIVITKHAAKRFRQRLGIDVTCKPKLVEETKAVQALRVMQQHLILTQPPFIDVDEVRYFLTYSKTIDGDCVCTIRTLFPGDMQCPAWKRKLKQYLLQILNDW